MTALCEVPRPLSELTASAGHCPQIKSALRRTAGQALLEPVTPGRVLPPSLPLPLASAGWGWGAVASRQPCAPPLWGSGLGRGSGTGGDQPHLSSPPRPGQRQRRPLPGPGLRGPSGQSGLRSSVVSPLEGGREAALALALGLPAAAGSEVGFRWGLRSVPAWLGVLWPKDCVEGPGAGGIAREGGRVEKSASRSRTVGRGHHQSRFQKRKGRLEGEVTRGSCRLLRPSPHSRDWGWSYLIGQSWGAGRKDLS